MRRRSRTQFEMEIRPVGLIGTILVVSSLCMFANLADHNWADNKRLILAFVFLGVGALFCAVEAVWDRISDRRDR